MAVAFPRAFKAVSPGQRILRATFWLLGLIHTVAAWLLVRLGRLAGRLLAFFPWSCKLGAMAAAMAILAIYLGMFGQEWLIRAAELTAKDMDTLRAEGVLLSLGGLSIVARYVGLLLLLATPLAFVRRRLCLRFLKIAGAAFGAIWLYLLFVILRAPSILYIADAKTFDKLHRNDLWVRGFFGWVPAAFLAVLFLLCLARRAVTEFYTRTSGAKEQLGDRVAANLGTHGGDPVFRTSTYWSAALHFSVLFLVPIVLRGCGGRLEEAYGIPKGSGSPVVQMVQIKRVKTKRIRREKIVLNVNSPILFFRPEIDESLIVKQIDQETQDQYVVTSLKGGGKLGRGGGTKGGWPEGMENAKVRFIRLEYAGGDWDQDMGHGADYNLLIQFHELTGFKIAENTEHIAISRLRRFPKHRGPPFVFLTGSGAIQVTREDLKILRWYCLDEGGLIFADNGGGQFHRHFKDLMRAVFPDLKWVDIANDDVLFRQPFVFPNGAPPIWHHSGMRALGLKHEGRWIVFYHQGDINDAWKTGHSGITEGQSMQAYRLGVNIINYAFNQYIAVHFGP